MIPLDQAVDRLTKALGGDAAARLAATALIESEARGEHRFGLAMLDEWAPGAKLPANLGTGPVAWLDCAGTFAPVAVAAATLQVAAAAGALGIGAAFLRGVRGFGRLAPFVSHLADRGLVGLAAAEGPPFVVPEGGNRPVIGTNPLALAMGQGADRVVIDAASSTATMAHLRAARTLGQLLPEGIAVDAAGQPTRIAADVAALLPRGGRIGSLLGLVVELLAGVAAGGRGDPGRRGVFLLAIDPDAAGVETDWRNKLETLRADWTGAGGHWPGGGEQPLAEALDAAATARLEAQLERMSAVGGW